MTRAQREMLVERYLTSEMNATEEQEFYMNVATDSDLFQTLRSHRLVERALNRDRDSLPIGYVTVQEKALAMLTAAQVAAVSTPQLTNAMMTSSRLGRLVTIVSTAVVFSLVGFVGRNALDTPAPTISQSAEAIQPQPMALDSLVSQPVTIPAAESDASKIVTPEQTAPVRMAPGTIQSYAKKRIPSAPNLTKTHLSIDSTEFVPRTSTVARYSDSPHVTTSPFSRLPDARDSVTFRMKIQLPKKGGR